jgi:YD repeat-containing protein
MKSIFTVVVVLFLYPAFSRQGPASNDFMRTDLISPSPTAANLSKYGDVPVTYYTGLPNISIPIFNITGSELSLPVVLSYNYSGLQPTQKASWVGLGWSLQAGGVITRTIGDKVDDHTIPYDKNVSGNVSPTQTYLSQSTDNAMYDNKPDIYNFNFGNYSGKFIWYEGEAYLMPYQKLKITGGSGGFTITTDDGTVYRFEEIEQTYPRGSPGSPYTIPTYTSSWYLTRITNATGTESISLYYESDGTMLQYGIRVQSYNQYMGGWNLAGYTVTPDAAPTPVGDVFPTRVTVKRLVKIVSDKYTVWFDGTHNREDIEMQYSSNPIYSRALSSIRVYAADNAQIRHINFNYFYSGGNGSKYLLLKSVVEQIDAAALRFQAHQFEYEGQNSSFGEGIDAYVDHFGFLKGTDFMPSNMYISNEIYTSGTDRTPNSAAKTGALKKITYPTGGSTVFTYENNRGYDGQKYVMGSGGGYKTATRPSPSTTNVITEVDTIEVPTSVLADITFSRVPKYIYPPGEPPPTYIGAYNDVDIEIRPVYSLFDDQGVFIQMTVGNPVYSGEIEYYANNGGQTDTVSLSSGRYVLYVICDDDENQVTGSISFDYPTTVPDPGRLGPGIRLKEIEHNNGFGELITKRFSYVDENGFSSGSPSRSNYDQKPVFKSYRSTQVFGGEVVRHDYIAHTSVQAESQGIGLNMYYRRVIEETIAGEETHRSAYYYHQFEGFLGVELMKKVNYLKVGNDFVVQKIVENTFSNPVSDFSFAEMEIEVDTIKITYESPQLTSNTYRFSRHLHQGLWKHPDLTTETHYENGNASVTSTKSYYDESGSRNLVAIQKTMSDGSSLFTKYKYPEDYATSVTSMNDLVSTHMLSQVIEQQVWKKSITGDSVMISGRINEYQQNRITAIYSFESADGISALDSEQTNSIGKYTNLISDSRYTRKVSFQYDEYGNVIAQQLEDNIPLGYLWGYPAVIGSGSNVSGRLYPIAEIKDASPNEVYHTSFEDDPTAATISSVTGFRSHENSFTIPVSFSGTYFLTYWIKTGSGPWQFVSETINNPSNEVINAIGSIIDEVRLYPVHAQIITYTYKPGVGIVSLNDTNNNISYYEYDFLGRLESIRDIKGNITGTYKYHIKDEINNDFGVD